MFGMKKKKKKVDLKKSIKEGLVMGLGGPFALRAYRKKKERMKNKK